jgi:hypothetical protein
VVGPQQTTDPYDTDCSGLVYGVYRKLGIPWKNGVVWPRLTANGYKYNAVPVTKPYRVGDVFCFMDSSGHCYHIGLYVGTIDGVEYTVEARGRSWGVKAYPLNDSVNGVLHRGAKMYRFPWVNLGVLSPRVPHPPLRHGMSGEEVKLLATLLNKAGWKPPLKGTGFFGSVTLAAVEWLQKTRRLEVDGIVDDLEWAILEAL